jgi:hypothetical protein
MYMKQVTFISDGRHKLENTETRCTPVHSVWLPAVAEASDDADHNLTMSLHTKAASDHNHSLYLVNMVKAVEECAQRKASDHN